ncbi:hypothetical protein E4U53_003126 [Claviceps sorghi]|nr:hypothetical protein E4U53_003126 [Claviceps sorghi]
MSDHTKTESVVFSRPFHNRLPLGPELLPANYLTSILTCIVSRSTDLVSSRSIKGIFSDGIVQHDEMAKFSTVWFHVWGNHDAHLKQQRALVENRAYICLKSGLPPTGITAPRDVEIGLDHIG